MVKGLEKLTLVLDELVAHKFDNVKKLRDLTYYGPKKDLIELINGAVNLLVGESSWESWRDLYVGPPVEFPMNPDPTNLVIIPDSEFDYKAGWNIHGTDMYSGDLFWDTDDGTDVDKFISKARYDVVLH